MAKTGHLPLPKKTARKPRTASKKKKAAEELEAKDESSAEELAKPANGAASAQPEEEKLLEASRTDA